MIGEQSWAPNERINWVRSIPFIIVHLMPLGAIFTGFGWSEAILCVALYYIRMFFLTAGYHRYFAHRSYKLGRVMQFVMGAGGALCAQKGPLWWAAYHRHHHRYSDQPQDVHSPLRGFWWSHIGWILCDKYQETRYDLIRDMAKYPEMRWLNRYWVVFPTLLGAACFFLGGASHLFIGFFLSTVLLYHGTFTVNSLAHVFGTRRYVTTDTSRNSLLIALITCGEGWHNNHHHLQHTAKQGFFWWELDPSYYVLKALSWVRLVRGLRAPSAQKLREKRIKDGHFDIGMFQAYWVKAVRTLADAQQKAGGYYDSKVKALADARRDAADFYDAKKKTLEAFAAQTLVEAQRQAGDFYDAKRKALEGLLETTLHKAESLRIVPKEGFDATS